MSETFRIRHRDRYAWGARKFNQKIPTRSSRKEKLNEIPHKFPRVELPLNLPNSFPTSLPRSKQDIPVSKSKDASKVEPKPLTDVPPPPAPNAPLKAKAEVARARVHGQSLGQGFAALTARVSPARRICGPPFDLGRLKPRGGITSPHLSRKSATLRDMGFHGPDKDEF